MCGSGGSIIYCMGVALLWSLEASCVSWAKTATAPWRSLILSDAHGDWVSTLYQQILSVYWVSTIYESTKSISENYVSTNSMWTNSVSNIFPLFLSTKYVYNMNFSTNSVYKKCLQYELAQRLIWAQDGILRLLRADNIWSTFARHCINFGFVILPWFTVETTYSSVAGRSLHLWSMEHW